MEPAIPSANGAQSSHSGGLSGGIPALLSVLPAALYFIGVIYWEGLLVPFGANSGLMSLEFHELVLAGAIALYVVAADAVVDGPLWWAALFSVAYISAIVVVGHFLGVAVKRKKLPAHLGQRFRGFSQRVSQRASSLELNKLRPLLSWGILVAAVATLVILFLLISFLPPYWVGKEASRKDLIRRGLIAESRDLVKKDGEDDIRLTLSDGSELLGRLIGSSKQGYALVCRNQENAIVVNVQAIKSAIRVKTPKQPPK